MIIEWQYLKGDINENQVCCYGYGYTKGYYRWVVKERK